MNEKEKQKYLDKYHEEKEKGIYFYPDALFKDAIVALIVFLILLALSSFLGAPLEERANPADTTYTPRPEWYFLFLFQLLKYFPGNLEIIAVVVIPTVAFGLLFLLPFIDKSAKRHFTSRPVITGITTVLAVGVIFLTFQALQEAPPPAQAATGDATAALYAFNCAGCHGASIQVPPGTDLHAIIAGGKHEGMPAWSADLSTDQIDALAGFILSPAGNTVFAENCSQCHDAAELVSSDPIELEKAFKEGENYPPHEGQAVQNWEDVLDSQARSSLLNFLIAPDGQRLFAVNCSPCHGQSISFSGDEEELRTLISEGGLHLEMPPWREKLNYLELDTLARYVVDPTSVAGGDVIFQQYCTGCHGDRVPTAEDYATAFDIIASGGAHETMPVWGQVLTPEQLDALVTYNLRVLNGSQLEVGQRLFAQNCASCHGDFGEGGENPTRSDDVIAPISTKEYLKTRDDLTLRSIISQGQPNFGMSPFGSAFGGPLEDDEIDAIVSFLRSWEADPPVELPPEVDLTTIDLSGPDIFHEICSQCHGDDGNGLSGPSLRSTEFKEKFDNDGIFDTINHGHKATAMIAWGEILTLSQVQELADYIQEFDVLDATDNSETETGPQIPSFETDVMPILESKCQICHGTNGGWDASSYDLVMTSGDNAPVIIPGDADGSLLALKILGTQEEGDMMPPLKQLSESSIKIILDWITAGAPNN